MNMDSIYLLFSLLHYDCFQFLTSINNFEEFTPVHLCACSELTYLLKGLRQKYLKWWGKMPIKESIRNKKYRQPEWVIWKIKSVFIRQHFFLQAFIEETKIVLKCFAVGL